MKRLIWLVVILVIVTSVEEPIIAQITVGEAKQSIRSFEGDPNLELPEPKDKTNPDAYIAKYYYRFELPDGREYKVDKETGWVFAASYPNSDQGGVTISEEEAVQIACNFLIRRSVIYQKISKRMIIEIEDGHFSNSYCINFIEKIPENGAYTYNQIEVDIDSQNGRIIHFSQTWERMPHPNRNKQPVFSAEEAANKLAAYFGFNAWDFDEEPKLFALAGDCAPFNWDSSGLVWVLDIVGDRGKGVYGVVDALWGSILMTDTYKAILSPYPKLDRPKIRLWVYRTERIVKTPRGDLLTADGFALKKLTPIIQRYDYGSKFTWLPIEVFKRFGADVKEGRKAILIRTKHGCRNIDKFLKHGDTIYLPARLLKEIFSDKIIDITTRKEGWVVIIIEDKKCLESFEDLREEIPYFKQSLRYTTKYRSFLDRREGQLMMKIGLIGIFFILIFFYYRKWRKINA